jgi:hypothetical protein
VPMRVAKLVGVGDFGHSRQTAVFGVQHVEYGAHLGADEPGWCSSAFLLCRRASRRECKSPSIAKM